jgi:CRP/FNR family cyclic AMP-dependent transcriptional regulator
VFIAGDDGRELVVNILDVGDYFGEVVLDGGPRSASVMTLDTCRLFVIPRADVEELLTTNRDFARSLIARLTGTVRTLMTKVHDLALKDVYGRFLRFVEENGADDDGQRVVPERLTQSDLAARIGGSREMVSRILRDLVAGGYVAVEAKRIKILKKLPPHW